jgi:two-component system cell cycle sensor histidine kinase/response regulator CckA
MSMEKSADGDMSVREMEDLRARVRELEAGEQRNLLQAVLEAIPSAVFWKDRDLRYLGGNRAWLKAAGLKSSQEVAGKSDYDLPWGKGQADLFREDDRRVMESGIPEYGIIEPYRRADGTSAWARTNKVPLRDTKSNVIGVLGTYEDITEQMKTEKALRESEREYRTLFETMAQGVIYYDAKGRIVFVNPAAERTLGFSLYQMQGRTLVNPDWHALQEDGSEFPGEAHPSIVALRTGKAVRNVVMGVFNPRIDDYRWVNINAVPQFRPGEDAPYQVFVTFDDITDRRQAERALRESELRYRTVADFTYDWETWIAPDGRILYSSPAFSRLTGYSADAMRRDSDLLQMIIDPRDREKMVRHFREELHDESSIFHLDFRIVTRQGQERWLNHYCVPVHDEEGRFLGRRGSTRDIHEYKLAEEALQESEELFRTVFEQAAVGIAQLMPDGRFTKVNHRFCEIVGYTMEELCGLTFRDITHPDDLQLDDNQIARVVAGEADAFEIEKRYVHKEGHTVWIRLYSNVVRDEQRSIKYAIGAVVDITERKRAEQEKVRLEEQFHQSQKLESIGRLAGGVAHDLNNLLTPILGYGEMLLTDTVGDDPRSEWLEQMVRAGKRAQSLVRQLLAFSRKQTLEFKHIDLNSLLRNFEKLLRRTIREDVAIHMVLARSLPPIRGDVGQLEQVVMNLAVNAQDAMPDGGALTIETGGVELDESYTAEHEGVTPGRYVMLVVSDTGCGMDVETYGHLFEPFFTTKGKDKGTGLGLATVYGIVKQHGGNVWAYSEPGLGATFKVYLPVATESPVVEESDLRTPSGLGGSETIMLVEDDEQVRNLVLAILKRQGYTVLVAESGKEALELLEGHDGSVQLLLTDVVLPEMNGKQLFERVSGAYPDVKVLYMSGYPENVIAHRGVMEPGIHFIQKPFTVRALAAKVREVLD